MARHGMVATSQPLATEIGVATLRRGGSAVDAAIAANAALGLTEPTSCGIGGDLFAIVWDAAGERLYGLNASGRSPLSLTLDRLLAMDLALIPDRGPLSVSVPGAVDGWCELHARFGRLPLRDLLAPSIAHAREGFPVTEVIGASWAAGARALQGYPGFAEVFMPNGRAPGIGEPFANPALARAYALIANEGRAAFYGGPIAAAIEDCVRGNGGFLGCEDLAAHRSEWVEPVSTTYRGWSVFELPPNGQGIAVLQMLNILEGFDLGSLEWGSAEHLHLLIEAKKLAFEDRAKFYADPEFAAAPVAAAHREGLRRCAPSAHRSAARRSGADSRRCGGRRRRHGLSRSGRRGRQHGVADPEQLHGLRLRRHGRAVRLRAAEPRLAVRARREARECLPARQAAVPHDHSGVRHGATARRCSRSG